MIRELVQKALDFCVEKNTCLKNKEGVVNMLLQEDNWVHSTFRYALGRNICEHLGIYCGELEEIYLTGSTLDNRAGFTSDVDLVVKVRGDSRALIDTLRRLDSDIMIYYRSLLGERVREMRRILNAEFVPLRGDESFVKKKRRLFHPPLLIWRRNFNSNSV